MISNPIKKPDIIVIDDNLNFRQGLIFLLTIDNVATVIGKASNGREFIDLLSHLRPDLVLMDFNLLHMNGMEATQKAMEMIPELKIIALTMYGDEDYYFNLNNLGIKGFLLKSSGINEVEKAIQKVMNGENYLSEVLLIKIIINFARRNTSKSIENVGLTPLETEVMQHVCHGFTNEEIAHKLCISRINVNVHKMNLLEKIKHQYTSAATAINSGQMNHKNYA